MVSTNYINHARLWFLLFIVLLLVGCGPTGLPQAITDALKSGDSSTLIPYMAAREDYVIDGGFSFTDRFDMEALSPLLTLRIVDRCKAVGDEAGIVWQDLKLRNALIFPDTLSLGRESHPYDENHFRGERIIEAMSYENNGDTVSANGIPADEIVMIEMESHGKYLSMALEVRRTPAGPKILDFRGCAALTLNELCEAIKWIPYNQPEKDAAVAALIIKGAVSEEIPWFREQELYSKPKIWVVIPAKFDPKEKDILYIIFGGSATELLSSFDRLNETDVDSYKFVSGEEADTKTIFILPRGAITDMEKGSRFTAEVNGVTRYFYPYRIKGRLFVSPVEMVKELVTARGGHGSCRVRYEGGLAKEIIWGEPDANHK